MPWKKALSDSQQAWQTGTLGTIVDFQVVNIGSGIANTVYQTTYTVPTNVKISKVAISWTAIGATTGTHLLNVVIDNGLPFNAYATNGVALATGGNDNSTINGYPTNIASSGVALFQNDLAITAGGGAFGNSYASSSAAGVGQGWITCTASGGSGVWLPTFYDQVYPLGYRFSLRATTPAATTNLFTNLQVTLLGEVRPITPTYVTQTVNGATIVPGLSF